MNVETMTLIRRLRAKRLTTEQICRITNLTPEEIKEAMWQRYFGNTEPTEADEIDGEPIVKRVERMKAEIRAANINKQIQDGGRAYTVRMPRHYVRVREIL